MIVGALLGAILFVACGWCSYVLSLRVLPRASASVRACGAALLAYWLLVAVFQALAALEWFRLEIALPLWVAAALLAHRAIGRGVAAPAFRRDLEAAGALFDRFLRSPGGPPVMIASIAIVGVRTLRGLIAPPLVWDALTYHLVKAGRWVQTGGFAREAAPDAWGYYEYFTPFGDVVWAWAMLPIHGDGLLAAAGLFVWLSVLLGAYCAVRSLGAAERPALLVALVTALTPAVVNFITPGHVENILLALFLLSFVFLHRASTQHGPPDALIAAGGLGLMAGVKFPAIAYLPLGLTLLAVAARSWDRRRRFVVAAACLFALAIGGLPYLRAWTETGSPTYPFSVTIGSHTIFHGNPQLSDVLSGRTVAERSMPADAWLVDLFVPSLEDYFINRSQFLNLGPSGLLLLVLGIFGAGAAFRHRRHRPAVCYLTVSAVLAVLAVLPDRVVALRTFWSEVLGRFLTVPIAAAAVLAGVSSHRLTAVGLHAALVTNLALAIPLGWGPADLRAMLDVSVWMLPFLGILAAAWRLPAGPASKVTRVVAPILLVAVLWRIGETRNGLRYEYYREASLGITYDAHRVGWAFSWPIWQHMDTNRPLRLAVTAGWDGTGHNWYRYPLLGSRLQNTLLYVPITRDGSIVDYQDAERVKRLADCSAWLRRLIAHRVEYVVLLPPHSIEADWVQSYPALFRAVASGFLVRRFVGDQRGAGSVYRFDQVGARALLESGPAAPGSPGSRVRAPAIPAAW